MSIRRIFCGTLLWCAMIPAYGLPAEETVREYEVGLYDLKTFRNRLAYTCPSFACWVSDARNGTPLFQPGSFSGTTLAGFVSGPFVLAPVRAGGFLKEAYAPGSPPAFYNAGTASVVPWKGWGGMNGLFCGGIMLPSGNFDLLALVPRFVVSGRPEGSGRDEAPFFSAMLRGNFGAAGTSPLSGEIMALVSEVPPAPARSESVSLPFFLQAPLFAGGKCYHAGARTVIASSSDPVAFTAGASFIASKAGDSGFRAACSASLEVADVCSFGAASGYLSDTFISPSGDFPSVTDFLRLSAAVEPAGPFRLHQSWDRKVFRPPSVPSGFTGAEELWKGTAAARLFFLLAGFAYEYRPRWSQDGTAGDSVLIRPSLEVKGGSWAAGVTAGIEWGSEKDLAVKCSFAGKLTIRERRGGAAVKPGVKVCYTLKNSPTYEWSASIDFGSRSFSGFVRAGTRKPLELAPVRDVTSGTQPPVGFFTVLSLDIGFTITDRAGSGDPGDAAWYESIFREAADQEEVSEEPEEAPGI